MKEIFERARRVFKEKYGREPGPGDPVMASLIGMTPEEFYRRVVPAWLEKGFINIRTAYAILKTLLVVHDHNRQFHPPEELEAWNAALKEYDDLESGKKSNSNPVLEKLVEKLFDDIEEIKDVYTLLLHKFSNDITEIELWETIDTDHYIGFCLTRNLKTIHAMQLLVEYDYGEDAMNLLRTNFENYLEIVYVKFKPEIALKHLEHKIKKKAETGVQHTDVKTDNTKKEKVKTLNNFEKASLNDVYIEEDKAIYKYLYDLLSSFTHPDINSAGSYVHEWVGFSIYGKRMKQECLIFLLVLNFMILIEIKDFEFFADSSKKDIIPLVNRLGEDLELLLKLEPNLHDSVRNRVIKAAALNK